MTFSTENLKSLTNLAIKHNASDIHLRSNEVPCLRVKGKILPIQAKDFSIEDIKDITQILLNKNIEMDEFKNMEETDGGFEIEGLCRIRYNFFRYNDNFGIILRIIKNEIPSIDAMGFLPVIKRISQFNNGLVLVTGATGSGKSTTLASMINEINENKSYHIITLEDPIEYIHPQKKSRISQREIGRDTTSYAKALKASLRQDPDVVLIGEMRDKETVDIALKASETGHCVFSTLHTTDALSTIGRIISLFPPQEQENIRKRLAVNLRATVSQRMLNKKDGGVTVAMEIMLNNPGIQECILGEEPLSKIPTVISHQKEQGGTGGQTFDQHLVELFDNDIISKEEVLGAITNQTEFMQRLIAEGKD
ncbi:MAG: PilT/PilU family type 4a pilus ATPase [Bdellovibrionales bacterium]|nr:PilT/PilU family type 4a pilus ATPase [Bdellovibrionales bacterium]